MLRKNRGTTVIAVARWRWESGRIRPFSAWWNAVLLVAPAVSRAGPHCPRLLNRGNDRVSRGFPGLREQAHSFESMATAEA